MSSEAAVAPKQATGTGKVFFWCISMLFVLSLPARLIHLNDSLWMDEAWVANSLVEPHWRNMFYYPGWTQSSPPLFLAIERLLVPFFGFGEVALRIFPDLSCIAGSFVVAAALGRRLSRGAAVMAFALLCSSYHLIKYSEQVKQYGSDFLVSAVILALVGRYLESRETRDFVLLAGTASIAAFLSYTAYFWFPSLLLVCLLPGDRKARIGIGAVNWKRAVLGALAMGAAFAVAYVVFVRPNHSAALAESLKADFLSFRRPWESVRWLADVWGVLMVAWPRPVSLIAGAGVCAIAAVTSILGFKRVLAGEEKGWWIVLAGTLPVASTIGASLLGIYPLLFYPRMSIFLLPCFAMLIGFAIDEAMRLARRDLNWKLAMGIGIVATMGAEGAFVAYRPAAEQNREAIALLQKRVRDRDVIFVSGATFEQFKYYRRLLAYDHPFYLANEHWACCATGDRDQSTVPELQSFAGDLQQAARRAGHQHLWLLLPAGAPGHWSHDFVDELNSAERLLSAQGCRREEQIVLGVTSVQDYRCGG